MIKDKRFSCLKDMPPKISKYPDREFDPMDNPMIDWMVQQPDLRKYLVDQARKTGLITYDPKTNTWRGINYGKATEKDTVLPSDEETAGNNGTGKGYANRTWKAGVF